MTVKKGRFLKVAAVSLLLLVALCALCGCFGKTTVISFNSNGGTACESITVTSDMTSITLPTPIRNGYIFDGWYSSRTSTTPLPAVLEGEDIPSQSMTFIARWTKKTVQITFIVDGTTLETRTVDADSRVEASSFPSLERYPDYEWKVEGFIASVDRQVVASEKPKPEPDHYVKYYVGEEEYFNTSGKAGDVAAVPRDPAPQDPNSYFSGWFADEKFTVPVENLPTTIADRDVFLYARFNTVTDDSAFLFYEDRPDGGINIIGLNDIGRYQSEINIPAIIDGKTVYSVGKNETGSTVAELGTFRSEFLERVTLPSTLREVGDWAFFDCYRLSEVIFGGNSVTSIGKGAFAGCRALDKIELPDNVTRIGDFAFAVITQGEEGLDEDFSLPEGALAMLPEGQWRKLVGGLGLLTLKGDSKLSSIGDYAFYACAGLSTVTLSGNMREFNYLAFIESGIESISFQANGYLIGIDGAVYSRSGTTLYYYPQNGESIFIMPENTREIAPYAFFGNTRIEEVQMGTALTTIGADAFNGCVNLSTVNASLSPVKTIGERAFAHCDSLEEIAFAAGLLTLGEGAFGSCASLRTVTFADDTLTMIGERAFQDCTALVAITIPSGVRTIGSHAFDGCSAMTELRFNRIRAVLTEIGDYAFYECRSIGEIFLPDGVQRIGKYAFASEKGAMSLYFNNNISLSDITYYGDYAFMNTQIDSVTISANIATNADFGKYVFKNCVNLKQAFISATGEHGYDTIPEGLFYGCTSLNRIVFPANVKIIDRYAFYNCELLERTEFSSATTEIREYAFYGCKKLTNSDERNRILPQSLKVLGERAFYGCSSLTRVYIPIGLKKIERETFARCTALADIYYDEGTTLETIGDNAFAYCGNLVTAMLPATLLLRDDEDTQGLVKNPFFGCDHLTAYEMTGDNANLFIKGGVVYRKLKTFDNVSVDSDQKAIYAFPTAKSSSFYTVSRTGNNPDDYVVSQVDRYAFYGCHISGLNFSDAGETRIVLVKIGDYAFAETKITTATINERVYSIGEGAFRKSQLTTLTIADRFIDGEIINSDVDQTTNLLEIGDYAFAETSLEGIHIPDRVASLGNRALAFNYSLAEIDFDDGDRTTLTLGDGVLENDNLLRTIKFPISLTRLGDYALYRCNNVEKIRFSTGLTSPALTLGKYAFSEIHYLYEIHLPENITEVGEGLFDGDTRLKYITFAETLSHASTLEIPAQMFRGLPTLTEITIPAYVERVGANAFTRSNLETITFLGTETDTDLVIGEYAFASLSRLKSVTLSGNLVDIGDYAFAESGLEELIYDDGKDLTIGDYAFMKTHLTSFKATLRVKQIGEYCFSEMNELQRFETDGGLEVLPEGAFQNCPLLDEIEWTGVHTIGKSCFENGTFTELQSDDLHTIGESAFASSALTTVALSVDGDVSIGKNAFADNRKLTSVNCLVTGDVTISEKAFGKCINLTQLIIDARSADLEDGFAAGASILGEGFVLTEQQGSETYSSFNGEKHILFSADGSEFVYYPPAMVGSTFVLDQTVVSIHDYAFYGNAGLTGLVVLGDDVTKGEKTFGEINSHFRIYVSEDNLTEYANEWQMGNIYAKQTVSDGLVLTLQSSGEYSVTGYLGTNQTLVVNGIVTVGEEEYTITSIGENAFRNNSFLRSVEIGNGIKSIGGSAFRGCENLESVIVGENVTNIKSYAFYDCVSLVSVGFSQGGSLLSIGNYAFAGNISLPRIEIPSGVETIGIFAFSGNKNLREAILGEGLKEIGNNVFEDCSSLPSIELPASLLKMGSYVYSGCDKMIYIQLNSREVCNIENNTFTGTPASIYFFVPDAASAKQYKVDSIWRRHISKILSVENRCDVDGFENYVLSTDGMTYTLIAYLGTEETLTIVSEVSPEIHITAIGEYSVGQFAKTVYLSEGIVELKERAFYNASELREIHLPTTLTTIGTYAFGYLENLHSVLISDSGTEEDPDENESHLTTIGDYAFYACYGMTDFVVPASVTTIGAYAFACLGSEADEYMNFISIEFSEQEDKIKMPETPNSKVIGRTLSREVGKTSLSGSYEMLYDKGEYIDREKAQNMIDNGVKYIYTVEENAIAIGNYAFAYNTKMREMAFGPERRVASFGEGAFYGCEALESLTISHSDSVAALTGDSKKTFEGCNKISIFLPTSAMLDKYTAYENGNNKNYWTEASNRIKLTLSSYVTSTGFVFNIMTDTSANKTAMIINYLGDDTEVIFPQKVARGSDMFTVIRIGREKSKGTDLNGYVIGKNVTSVVIPTGVTTIGENAFRDSPNLQTVSLSDTVTDIEKYAFAHCPNLRTINIPVFVKKIGEYAFYDCDNLDDGLTFARLTNPPTTAYLVIDGYAFADCNALTTFFVPNHVLSIGVSSGHTFDGCTNLQAITFADASMIERLGSYVFKETAIKEITLPTSMVEVYDFVFAGCMNLQTVYLKRTITGTTPTVTTTRGVRVFDGIPNAHLKVYVPDEFSFTSYSQSNYGWGQKTIVIDNVTLDGRFAYTANDQQRTVTITDYRGDDDVLTIPDQITTASLVNYTVVTLGKYFANDKVKKVVFGVESAVSTLEDYAFAGCTSLEEIHLPERVTNLGAYAFYKCTSLRDIRLSETITEIKTYVFNSCTSLEEITLPSGINYIGSSSFGDCVNLARVKIEFGKNMTSLTGGQVLDGTAFEYAGTAAGGMTIIVKNDYKSKFEGWTKVRDFIYEENDVVGDFVVKLNESGTALILVQYLGYSPVLDLNELTLKGLKIQTVAANSVRNDTTKFIANENILLAEEYVDRVITED